MTKPNIQNSLDQTLENDDPNINKNIQINIDETMSFKEFIKLHAAVDNDFIDSFFNTFNEKYISTYSDFIINAKTLAEWLEIKEYKNFIHKMKKRFKEGIDYEIKYVPSKIRLGARNKLYFFTVDTAKEICLSTKSKKAKEVRNYFKQVEYLLHKYYIYIIDHMKDVQNEILKNKSCKYNEGKQKRRFLYVYKTNDENEFKLGITTNRKQRDDSHNCALSIKLIKVFEIETSDHIRLESCVKNALKPVRVRKNNEIYEIKLATIKKIILDCEKFIGHTDNIIDNNLERGLGNTIFKKLSELDSNDKVYMFIREFKSDNIPSEDKIKDLLEKELCDETKNITENLQNEQYSSDDDENNNLEEIFEEDKVNGDKKYYFKKYLKYKTKYFKVLDELE